jgi:hypothetical protein
MREYREQFAKLSVDELWTLYTDVDQILAARIVVKKKELERRFEQLRRANGGNSWDQCAHHCRLATAPKNGATLAADLADKPRLDIGLAQIVRLPIEGQRLWLQW